MMTSMFKNLLLSMVLMLTISACNDENNDIPQPTPTTGYVSAEAYLEEVGFVGSAFIRKGNTEVLKQGFGMADLANGISNKPGITVLSGASITLRLVRS